MAKKQMDRRKGNPHGRKSFDRKCERTDSSESTRGRTNDVSWYMKNKALADNVTNFPFSHSLGLIHSSFGNMAWNPGNSTFSSAYPGIVVYDTVNIPGVAESNGADAVNVIARKLYAYVRHANSGSKNYESSDMVMYLLAMDSLYSMYASGLRAYGLVPKYSYSNRYLPRDLVEATGFDYDDIVANQAEMRFVLERLRKQLSALAVPAEFTYFKRHVWMYGNVFQDDMERKPQYYLYRMAGYHLYSGFSNTTGGELIFSPWNFTYMYGGDQEWEHWHDRFPVTDGTTGDFAGIIKRPLMRVSDFRDICDIMVQRLTSDEDINIMSGDILKAFGAENLIKWNELDMFYEIQPVYDRNIMLTLENSTAPDWRVWEDFTTIADPIFIQTWADTACSKWNIVQKNNQVSCKPGFPIDQGEAEFAVFRWGFEGLRGDVFINIPSEFPTNDEVMYATRSAATWTIANSLFNTNGNYAWLDVAGSDVVVRMNLYVRNLTDNGYVLNSRGFGSTYLMRNEGDVTEDDFTIACISNCDHVPHISLAEVIEAQTDPLKPMAVRTGLLGKLDNFTTIDAAKLDDIHEVALMSMLTTDKMGQFA